MTRRFPVPEKIAEDTTPAVLFLIFNRPELTARTFAAIRAAKPSRLYIAADGPRSGHATDAENCRQARTAVGTIDWPCEVNTLFRDANLGCSPAISSAIDWFFAHEHEGVILEDDCLPGSAFFSWCQFGLRRFADDARVIMLSGYPFEEQKIDGGAIQLSKYTSIWGWATWRNRWVQYRRDAANLSLRAVRSASASAAEASYWQSRYHLAYEGSWDYRLCLYSLGNGLLSAIPPIKLIANQATIDGADQLPPAAKIGHDWDALPVVQDGAYDERAFKNVFNAPHMRPRLSLCGRAYVHLRSWAALTESRYVLAWFDAVWQQLTSLRRLLAGRNLMGE